ncbi:hypothetical protein LTR56_012330 [Elasticomyces elasticus]|nr:hypothetical protein LTR56_012330 [Elasticomyces elasticus]KAK3641286.1 hypothetical protein LTR22_016654 [Elasticomyces elasticus]KAK4922615.1 hypothetical protein LTR49_010142 [Elasticomyces elasticus]KAK5760788.1 hypothetical protein LTS12_009146 [Elasticomyces elasticus]
MTVTSKLSLQYMSDLQLERIHYEHTVTPAGPVLILAGDIGRFCDYDKYRDFLTNVCNAYELVLLIAGNHEFYGSSREEGLEAAARPVCELPMHGKLQFLNRGRADIPGSDVTVLGCTLHSHISPDYTALTNDFERIKNWSVKAHNEEHAKDLQWLKASLKDIVKNEPQRKVVVVTHYAPLFQSVAHPMNENNALAQCFSSSALEDVRREVNMPSASYWIFGHTHRNAQLKCPIELVAEEDTVPPVQSQGNSRSILTELKRVCVEN